MPQTTLSSARPRQAGAAPAPATALPMVPLPTTAIPRPAA